MFTEYTSQMNICKNKNNFKINTRIVLNIVWTIMIIKYLVVMFFNYIK